MMEESELSMDVGTFYETVLVTVLMVITFFVLILTFLYMIYAREEAPATEKPKSKSVSSLRKTFCAARKTRLNL